MKDVWRHRIHWRHWVPLLLVGIAALILGYFLGGGLAPPGRDVARHEEPRTVAAPAQAEVWTCSMHPQIRQPRAGQCPICGMDLIPVDAGASAASGDQAELALTPRAQKRAGIQVAPVERKFVTAEVRMVGKVTFDETRLAQITAWIPGRLDRLYVDYTGIPVRQGDHMVELYSPELLSAQQELIEAVRAAEDLQASGLGSMRASAQANLDASREKLRLWGLTGDQISAVEATGTPSDRMTIYAPISGIVIHKDAVEGMYVQTGTKIYAIADLSHVWVKLEAYESDLAWIRYGQEIEFETEAYPGEIFSGRIAFIDPLLDAQTRTANIRLNVPNDNGRLKPEMFVRAIAYSRIAAGGRVMDPEMAGKWICPMHPEVVKLDSNTCDLCGMPLVQAESLGYLPVDAAASQAPLVIPVTAPLITGKRAVVYVEDPNRPGTYAGREIVLGPRAGDYYLVRAGLTEGEQLVVNGNFKIDSAIQILAGPSMMNPPGTPPGGGSGHAHGPQHAGHPSPETGASPTHAAPPAPHMSPSLPHMEHVALDTGHSAPDMGNAPGTGRTGHAVRDTATSPPHLDPAAPDTGRSLPGADSATPETDNAASPEGQPPSQTDMMQARVRSRPESPLDPGAAHPIGPLFTPDSVPTPFKTHVDMLLTHYFDIQAGLSLDQLDPAKQSARMLLDALAMMPAQELTDQARTTWTDARNALSGSANRIANAGTIESARDAFSPLSQSLMLVVQRFGTGGNRAVLRFHCPMAFGGRGADWLQDHPGTENPYYGSMMFRCGDQTETLVAPPAVGTEDEDWHEHDDHD